MTSSSERESFKKFWAGAMGNAAKELKNSDEGAGLSILHNISKELERATLVYTEFGSQIASCDH